MSKESVLLARVDEKTKYIAEKVDSLHSFVERGISDCNDRINIEAKRTKVLENWRSFLTGGYVVVSLVITGLFIIIFN